jgi:hypothetical protein
MPPGADPSEADHPNADLVQRDSKRRGLLALLEP